MKKLTYQGLTVTIENPAGSVRSGKDKLTGKKWSAVMPWDYGYFNKTEGVDGDEVDCFIGPNKHAKFAFVIHQLDKNIGNFDEDKVMLGFNDAMEAKAAYYKAFDLPDQFYGTVEAIPMDTFKEKLKQTKANPQMIHASKMNKAIALYSGSENVTHEPITVGSEVTMDGMTNYRGIVKSVKGDRITVKFRNGVEITKDIMYVHNIADRTKKMWSDKMNAAEEGEELEGSPIRTPATTKKRIKKVGTQFCIETDGVDKNLGCWPSIEKAEAVMSGKSFIEDDLLAGKKKKKIKAVTGNMPQTGWQYGKRTMPVGYVPARTLSGFPSGKGGGRGGLPKVPMHGTPKPSMRPHISAPRHTATTTGHRPPNPAGKIGHGVRFPNPPLQKAHETFRLPRPPKPARPTLESFADGGEPVAGAYQHAHMDSNMFFHPPSLLKRNKETHIPVDEPNETNNRFGDVDKRKQSHSERMKLLKRSSPGNTLIPVHTTLLPAHQGSLGSSQNLMAASIKTKKHFSIISRPARGFGNRGMRVSYARRGCI